MRALVCSEAGVRLETRPTPSPARGEALLAVEVAGICNTDLEIARGYMGFRGVLGHEIVGRVLELGPDTALPEGLGGRVATEINCACLSCPTCAGGGRNHCPHRTVLGILGKDGGLAERVAVPVANLHPIPDALDDEAAAFVEPLAAAMHAFDEAAPRPGDRVLIIGDGKLGLLCALTLAARAGDLGRAVLMGRHSDKLAIARRAGLEVVESLEGAHFDVVVEATGQPSGLTAALRLLRPRGKLVLKSTYAGAAGVDLAPIVINELTVIGSRCGAFPRAVEAIASGRIDPRPLVSARYALAEAEAAFSRAGEHGVLKVLVRP